MKGIFLLSLVLLSASAVSCVKPKSVAGAYKEKMAKGSADGGVSEGELPPEEGDPEPEVPAGDVEKGKTLLAKCTPCHKSDGLAKTVTLNADAVGRLEDAYTGAKKDNHTTLADAFVDGRADLEAAMNEVAAAALKLQKSK